MRGKPENVIGVTEIARLLHVAPRSVQRIAKGLPGRLPPHRAPWRGHWFERGLMLKYIARHKRREADMHRPGRKRMASPPEVSQRWRKLTAEIPQLPYEIFRSGRRAGVADFAARLGKLADGFAELPQAIGKTRAKVKFQGEYDQILAALRKIRENTQHCINRFIGAPARP